MRFRLAVIAWAVLCLGSAHSAQAARLTVNADGTVSDAVTGLVWQRQDDNQTRLWKDALAYCENLVFAGADTWRLPNVKELRSIVDDTVTQPGIDSSVFPNTKSTGYWTSTTRHGAPNFAWYIYFSKGLASTDMKTNPNYVRCVR